MGESILLEWSGKVKHVELPVDQLPGVAFNAFADAWPRTTEMEIGAALCAIGAGRTLNLTFLMLYPTYTVTMALIQVYCTS